jgi:hypothetical protein
MSAKFVHLFENPDILMTGKGTVKYNDTNKTSYTVAIFPHWGWSVVLKKDEDIAGSGHTRLFRKLYNMANSPELYNDEDKKLVLSNLDYNALMGKMENPINSEDTFKARIWTDFKVVSFWDGWKISFIRPILYALKLIGENPEEYAFEMDGGTMRGADSPDRLEKNRDGRFLTFKEFSTDGQRSQELSSEEREAQVRKVQDMEMYRRLMDDPASAMKQIKLNKANGFDPITGKPRGKVDGIPFYRRMGD